MHCFVYLGSTINMTNTFDNEISLWIKKVSNVFKKWGRHQWSQDGISIEMKLKVYKTYILSSLLYVRYKSLIRDTWKDWSNFTVSPLHIVYLVANVYEWYPQSTSIESLVLQRWLWWSCHVVRMMDNRIPWQWSVKTLPQKKVITTVLWLASGIIHYNLNPGETIMLRSIARKSTKYTKNCNVYNQYWSTKWTNSSPWQPLIMSCKRLFRNWMKRITLSHPAYLPDLSWIDCHVHLNFLPEMALKNKAIFQNAIEESVNSFQDSRILFYENRLVYLVNNAYILIFLILINKFYYMSS